LVPACRARKRRSFGRTLWRPLWRGASTLSQTAKNLFLWGGQSWPRKGLEAGLTELPSPRRYSVTAPGVHVRERQRWILGQLPTVRQLPGVDGLLARQDRCPPAA